MSHTGVIAVAVFLFPSNPGLLKDGRERSVAAVRERICPALAIMRDEPTDGHGLHRMCGDADRGVVSSSRDAEQNYAIVCAKRGCQFFHWPSPTYQNTRDHKGSLVYLAAHTHSVNGR